MIYEFLDRSGQQKKITGNDGIGAAYLFPKNSEERRDLFEYLFKIAGTEEVIIVDNGGRGFTFSFSDIENGKYLKYGWSYIENTGTWSNSKSAVLFLDFKELTDYNIDIVMRSLPGLEISQEVEIFINRNSIGSFTLRDVDSKYTSFIPESILVSGNNILEIRAKVATSPVQLGISDDSRNLAVYFSQLRIY